MEGPEPTPGQSSKPPTDHADPTVVGPHLDELFSGLTHGIEWGLERMEGFLRETGNPHESYSAVHIGGTNGKGSVAATIASVLDQTGPSTGLYTSPHLCSFRERFRVAGQPVEEDELRALAGEFKDEDDLGGDTPKYSDWRLPNIRELRSPLTFGDNGAQVTSPLAHNPNDIWSSTYRQGEDHDGGDNAADAAEV